MGSLLIGLLLVWTPALLKNIYRFMTSSLKKIGSIFLNHPNFFHTLTHIAWEKVENGLIPILDHASKHQIEVDLQDILLRFMYDTISTFMMEYDPRSLSIDLPNLPLIKSVTDVMQWLNVGKEKRHNQGIKILDEFIYMCINKKREKMKKGLVSKQNIKVHDQEKVVRLDLLTLLLMDKNENIDSPIIGSNEKFLRDTMSNFFLAGGESTSTALSWFFYLLSKNPHVLYKIKAELEENNMKQMNDMSMIGNFKEFSDKLVYFHAALCESLRLYPTVPFNHKKSTKLDVLPSGHRVTPSTEIIFNMHAMGRMKSIWGDDCNEYKQKDG
ncbi:Alkane hydroxylase MAH1 [Bienertia sinuspersici]